MKILSKFKDYYDYLQGIYGIDENLILDRTEFTSMTYKPSINCLKRFIIGDYLVEGLWHNNKMYYGKEIENLDLCHRYFDFGIDKEEFYSIKDGNFSNIYVLKQPKLLKDSPAYKYKCPILIHIYNEDYDKNPILKEYSMNKVFSPVDIWLILSEFLGKLKDTNKESIQSNSEKIIAHGFDLKSSFRNIK
jgi:hypothetical protein